MSRCKYHPTLNAVRTCEECNASYCDQCCDESPLIRNHNAEHACFICRRPLRPIKGQSNVEPFWRRLGPIYRYPIGMSALIAILLISFLSALFANMGIYKLAPHIAITLYCFACLRETAQGNMEAPGIEACFEGGSKPFFSMIVLFIFAAVVTYFVFDLFGTGLSILVGFFFIVTLPAAMMVIAIDGALIPALNPAKLVSVVTATGVSYFIMLLFLLIMMSSVALLVSFFMSAEPTFMSVLTQSVISNYYSVVEFHILGYLVYQNQYKLGFSSTGHQGEAIMRSNEEWLNAKVEIHSKAGDYANAIDAAKRQIANPASNMWQWQRCFRLMCTGTDFDELKSFAPKYFDKLDTMGQHDQMADAYVMVKKRIRSFKINDNERCLTLARSLFEIDRFPYVIDLLKNYHTRDAKPEQINESLELISQSYLKIPGKEKKAEVYQNLYQLRNAAG